jgi:5,6-dimethylbenzimidazole synthase
MAQDVGEFPADWKRGVYEAILRRRDIRKFKPDAVPLEVLARVLNAAHHAASVGFMQPWNFLLIDDVPLREELWKHVDAERTRAAANYSGERKTKYLSYKLEGIREAPLNICVTCDTSRNPSGEGPHVLGRNTIRETDLFSTCGAIQNLWLAARAEGLGVGWVSILEMDFLKTLLKLPDAVVPVAYLCVGYPQEFPEKPMLETTGWSEHLKLEDLVFKNTWGAADVDVRRALGELDS